MVIEETSVSKKNNRRAVVAAIFEIISTVLFAVFALGFVYGLFARPVFLLFVLPVLAMSFLFRVLSLRANVSFDYTVRGGLFIIGKIISNKKRKQIFELTATDMINVTEVAEDIPEIKEIKDKKTKMCIADEHPHENKSFVLIETAKELILIEAGERLLSALKNRYFY